MAAYASTCTILTDGAERISRNLGLVIAKLDITNYNSTTTEETTLTRLFKTTSTSGYEKGILSLQVMSSENGYQLGFDPSTGKFKAYYAPARTHAHDLKIIAGVTEDEGVGIETTGGPILGSTTGFTVAKADSATKGGVLSETLAAAALTEVANDVDLGTFIVQAIGFIPGGAR